MRLIVAIALIACASTQGNAAAGSATGPVVITLGTGGGPVVQTERAQPATAIQVGKALYLFDLGDGTQRALKAAGLPLAEVRAVFLTHHHIDHVGGLPPMIVNRWINGMQTPLPVVGPPGTMELVAGLVAADGPVERAPLKLGGAPHASIRASVAAVDAVVGDVPVEVYADDQIRVLAILVDHYHHADGRRDSSAQSFAYRIEADGKIVVISGDTGPSKGLERLATGADILVSEVVDRDAIAAALSKMSMPIAAQQGFLRHINLDHLTPTEVGHVARAAGVRRVVLTHLVPGLDGETSTAGYTTGISPIFTGPVVVARDGDRFEASAQR